MKLTKQQKSAALKAHDLYWESYLKGDIDQLSVLLVENYSQIGSVEEEVFFNKKNALKFVFDTIDQVAGKVEMRNRKTTHELFDDFILIYELCDLYVLIENEWTFYSRFRATTLLQEKPEGWKIVHQHSSLPDTKAQEGDNIAIEKISEENLQLRDAIKRRTIELENKNRELEIEAALERVRASAMAMQKSGDLKTVVEILYGQLRNLGFKLGAASIIIMDLKTGDMDWWMEGFGDGYVLPERYHVPFFDHSGHLQQLEHWKSGTSYAEVEISGQEKKTYDAYYFYQTDFSQAPESSKQLMMQAETVRFSMAFMKYGALCWSPTPLSTEQPTVLERFAKVFEQCYTRFLDLQKAEAQTREAQIEAALEKIRSRSLAMHSSKELRDVIATMIEKLEELKVIHGTLAIQLFDFETLNSIFWPGNNLQEEAPKVQLPFDQKMMEEDTCHRDLWNAKEKGEAIFNKIYTRQQKDRWFEYVFAHNDTTVIEERAREYIRAGEVHTVCFFPEKNAALFADSWDGSKYSEEEFMVLKRVAKVFDQAYTRFLDLQKAEAQARESQIEAALERVRSHTMAMQKSNDLNEVIGILYQEIKKLDGQLNRAFIISIDSQTFDSRWWMASGDQIQYQSGLFVQNNSCPFYHSMKEAWEKRVTKWNYKLEGKEKQDWDSFVFFETELVLLPEVVKENMIGASEAPCFATFQSFGCLLAASYGMLSEDAFQLLIRFSKAFDQSYTRFLDLKNAEAQAREAQIEAGLERVRSAAMAMHQSDDLRFSLKKLFEELDRLQLGMIRCGIAILDPERPRADVWIMAKSGDENAIQLSGDEPLDTNFMLLEAYQAWKEGNDYEYFLEGKRLSEYYHSLDQIKFQSFLTSTFSKKIKKQKQHYFNAAFKHGSLFAFFEDQMPESGRSILKRFSNVLNLAYSRFRDIQSAEAQAREAQIQLALERVRARTMAMQRSDELAEAAQALYQQFGSLEIPTLVCGFIFIQEEKGIQRTWTVLPDGSIKKDFIDFPLTGDRVLDDRFNAWKQKVSLHKDVVAGKENKAHHDFLAAHVPDEIAKDIFSHLPDTIHFYSANFNFGYLHILREMPFNSEEETIVIRFAKVFEQTYTRFLDLQKAEAQAREAKIETALEKVRSKSLTMHRSEELQEVVTSVFDRLKELDIQTDAINLDVFNENKKDAYLWTAVPGHRYSKAIHVPYTDSAIFKDIYDGMISRKSLHSNVYSKELKDQFLNYIFEHTDFREIPQERKDLLYSADASTVSVAYAKNTAIIAERYRNNPFSDDENEILKRFAKVFDQAYTRFLDLQKAEAQGREAQIQLVMERIRARTMAMRKSEELTEAANLLFQQMQTLGMPVWSAGYFILDEDKQGATIWMSAGVLQPPFRAPLTEEASFIRMREAFERGEEFYVDEVGGEELIARYQYLRTLPIVGEILDSINEAGHPIPTFQIFHFAYFSQGCLVFITYEPVPEEHDIFKRFGKVFEQTYTRFLDLQKAEAQAREAQIEASLERVRARTMAMHKSEELQDAAHLLFKQVQTLGIPVLTCGYNIWEIGEKVCTGWMSSEGLVQPPFKIPLTESPTFIRFRESREKGISFYFEDVGGDALADHYKYMISLPGFSAIAENFISAGFPLPSFQVNHVVNFTHGNLIFISSEAVPEAHEIFKRFAIVFEQTYTRFLDLQKAEAQARDAQIEASLERVRSRTMAMHNSEDVTSATETMFDELKKLGIENLRCGIANIHPNKTFDVFGVTNLADGNKMSGFGLFGLDEHPIWQRWFKSWKNKEEVFIAYIAGQEKEEYFNNINNHRKYLPQKIAQFPDSFFQAYLFEQGSVWAYSLVEHSEPEKEIMKRFATGFSLTFRRYQDLKKAEFQAREAQIENALEKVRSRTMAMQHSDELAEAAFVLFQQLQALGVVHERINIGIVKEESKTIDFWITDQGGNQINTRFTGRIDEPTTLSKMYMGWKKNQKSMVIDQTGEDLANWLKHLKEEIGIPFDPEFSHNRRVQTVGFFSKGMLVLTTPEPLPEENLRLLEKFAGVFDLTYTRFSDLKHAEAQAREAQIEAALEKVRSRSLAMHKSDELQEVISTVLQRLNELGLAMDSAFVGLASEDKTGFDIWIASNDYKYSENLRVPFGLNTAILSDMENFFRSENAYFSKQYSKEEKDVHYKSLFELSSFKHITQDRKDFLFSCEQYGISMAQGKFSMIQTISYSGKILNELEAEILKRFSRVFEQAYTRFLDLQKAEAQAREATKQASLDRVRGVIASMRSAADLELITPLIFKELTILGIPFIRCGVFIIDEKQELVNAYLSSPEGNSLGVLKLPYLISDLTQGTVEAWRKGLVYTQHWNKEDFVQWINLMMEQDQIQDSTTYQGAAAPPESLNLHFVPFTQGMLYVGANSPLIIKEIELVQALAKAFSIAYARYEDFEKLDKAKAEIESALSELKATQAQLIQSEKMASLGQLTAGIAHEIKNPLNFVNNFSEVSGELIDEVFEELEKLEGSDRKDEIIAILMDVKNNIAKVNEHGKRADGIVKSMLQHSRSSGNKIESSPFNPIVREYANLAYHGMRAGKSPINVEMDFQLDQEVGEVKMISEDFSRVILNLCNNAFDAMREKLQEASANQLNFSPKLTITTKKTSNEEIQLTIRDNGKGIPKDIIDKILEPFFTTKKGTEGTGLGLSISYDIIKAHGGELEVRSKVGKGTEFIIRLPIAN